MTKDGGREAMDYYFHQIAREPNGRAVSQAFTAARAVQRPPRPIGEGAQR